ncbi:PREDICTED: protein HEXIM-like [Amphimedon queenslandica]|uniref:Protein HEXIM1 n=1 Tax=Amphimedon queenslandica TaxID=400682 RepID=A0A1X7VA66_AMPQE|nr:PREDICTED: protein HEXIM-like [Amphimedon queenslandica]XP_019850120.1 PREDICTED: protein HEXIM-like [Amphimedon queenslandica]|eukprot:XP_019850119.1 PREDICTED: protein HEXIM-like [Amphimedon queenslandica]
MLIVRPFPLSTSSSYCEPERTLMERAKSCSMSDEEDGRIQGPEQVAREKEEGPPLKPSTNNKKHRRGKKRSGGPGGRPKWKPYSKMSLEERKQVDEWEEKHVAIREAEINARSKRPVAPFNSTQFLIDDRCEDQYRRPSRTLSFDSSSGDDVHYDLSDEDQEAFLEADFNQVYLQLKLNRLEGMSKQDLISQCCNLEDKVSVIEQEKMELLSQLHQLKKANGMVTESHENNNTTTNDITTTSH